jgi:hypothetical protein
MSRHWNGLITPLPMNSFLFLIYNLIDAFEPMNRLNNRCIMQQIIFHILRVRRRSCRDGQHLLNQVAVLSPKRQIHRSQAHTLGAQKCTRRAPKNIYNFSASLVRMPRPPIFSVHHTRDHGNSPCHSDMPDHSPRQCRSIIHKRHYSINIDPEFKYRLGAVFDSASSLICLQVRRISGYILGLGKSWWEFALSSL